LNVISKTSPNLKKLSKTYFFETDHIVELELMEAALNILPDNTYRREGWAKELFNFFNSEDNLRCMEGSMSQEKK